MINKNISQRERERVNGSLVLMLLFYIDSKSFSPLSSSLSLSLAFLWAPTRIVTENRTLATNTTRRRKEEKEREMERGRGWRK